MRSLILNWTKWKSIEFSDLFWKNLRAVMELHARKRMLPNFVGYFNNFLGVSEVLVISVWWRKFDYFCSMIIILWTSGESHAKSKNSTIEIRQKKTTNSKNNIGKAFFTIGVQIYSISGLEFYGTIYNSSNSFQMPANFARMDLMNYWWFALG